jgi:hypothetical protein
VQKYRLELSKVWIQLPASNPKFKEELCMVRPTGVTVIAILCFIGAALAGLCGIGMIVGGGFVATIMNKQGQAGSESSFSSSPLLTSP